jgi:hypothetical protein
MNALELAENAPKNGNPVTVTPTQINIMDDIKSVLDRHNEYGCTESDCGCPGSQLRALYERLLVEFPR